LISCINNKKKRDGEGGGGDEKKRELQMRIYKRKRGGRGSELFYFSSFSRILI
jgi:hypothetical protein